MDLQLKDKVIIVTGGAKGIGAGIVQACAAEGAMPVIVGRDADAGKQVQDEIQRTGGRCGLISVELSTPESCSRSVDQVLKDFGRLDGLVNNAGRNDKVGLEDGNPDEYVASLQPQPRALLRHGALLAAAPEAFAGQHREHRLEDRSHRTRQYVRIRLVERRNYGAHPGVGCRTAALRNSGEYRDSCRSHDSAVPQWLDTFPNPKEKLANIISKIPLDKRMTTSEEIAAMVVFLISPKSSHTTGQHMFVDGGYVHLDRALT